MRFIIGPPPDDSSFVPDEKDGWRRLRELGPRTLMILGALIGVPLSFVFSLAWLRIPGVELSVKFDVMSLGRWGAVTFPLIFIGSIGGFLFGLIFVHELVHVLACPRFGFTSATVLGVWPSRLLAYGNHSGPVTCRRFMLVGAAPFVVLSVLPLLIAWLGVAQLKLFALVSMVNAMLCGGDALICLMLLHQVPLNATVRNKGWDTWWRPANPPEMDGRSLK